MKGETQMHKKRRAPAAAKTPTQIRLNIGAGTTTIPGFKSLDVKTGTVAHALPYPANSVQEIRASHVLEHYACDEVGGVVLEWFRVLAPGGIVRIAVPDFEAAAKVALRDGQEELAHAYIMGGQTDAYDFHKSLFSFQSLMSLMRECGLVNIMAWHSEIKDCAALPVSLNLQGTKPGLMKPSVVAVASVPRFGPTLHSRCCMEALVPLQIPMVQTNGAFWGQCLTRAFNDALKGKPDYILTVDFDTVFRPWNVEALIDVMQRNPHIHALCPVQCHRGLTQILASVNDDDGNPIVELTDDVLKVETLPLVTGHFGLTLFRTAAFEKLPRPWFLPVPDPDGGWDERRVDEDIYFWKQWRAAGLSLFLANRVVVGHMMELIAWPNRTLQPVFQNIGEFYTNGTPRTIWV